MSGVLTVLLVVAAIPVLLALLVVLVAMIAVVADLGPALWEAATGAAQGAFRRWFPSKEADRFDVRGEIARLLARDEVRLFVPQPEGPLACVLVPTGELLAVIPDEDLFRVRLHMRDAAADVLIAMAARAGRGDDALWDALGGLKDLVDASDVDSDAVPETGRILWGRVGDQSRVLRLVPVEPMPPLDDVAPPAVDVGTAHLVSRRFASLWRRA